MSDAKAFGFGQFIPGYDFLQQLTQASQGSSLPPFSSWVAPTVSVEEIDKRIEELKAVQFWLEQNNRALSATVQALQVQKMTLSTLKGMNVNLTDFAQAFGSAAAPSAGSTAQGNVSNWPMDAAPKSAQAAPQPEPAPQAAPQATPEAATPAANATATATAAMQWWNALTQQFQTIATQALQDPAQLPAMAQAASMASDFTKAAVKTASDLMQQAVNQASAPVQAAQGAARTPAKKASAAAKKPVAPKTDAPAAPATGAASKTASTKAPAKKASTGKSTRSTKNV